MYTLSFLKVNNLISCSSIRVTYIDQTSNASIVRRVICIIHFKPIKIDNYELTNHSVGRSYKIIKVVWSHLPPIVSLVQSVQNS